MKTHFYRLGNGKQYLGYSRLETKNKRTRNQLETLKSFLTN